GVDDFRAEREVRDEAAVHHVDVQPIRAASLAHRDVLGQTREIRAQQRRRDPHARLDGTALCAPAHGEPPMVRSTREPDATCEPAGGDCAAITAAASATAFPPFPYCTSPTPSPAAR